MSPFDSSKRRFFRLAGGAAAAAVVGDSFLWEPYRPVLTRVEARISRLPEALDGFTIAQLSDFHYDPMFGIAPIEAAVNLTNSLSPDLVALTGDFVTLHFYKSRSSRQRSAAHAYPCAELLARLKSRVGSYAVLGNHDAASGAATVTEALEQHGIRVLTNRSVPIERDGVRFWLAGVGDVMERGADLQRALRGIDRNQPAVLLAHEPDFADQVAGSGVDVQLSGHSHGGQVCLPGLGPLYLPPLARKYPWGLRQIEGLTLYTNAGIGTIHVPVRWNCRPEITLVTLRKGGR